MCNNADVFFKFFGLLCKIFVGEVSTEVVRSLKTAFYAEPRNILAQNACFRTDPLEVGDLGVWFAIMVDL